MKSTFFPLSLLLWSAATPLWSQNPRASQIVDSTVNNAQGLAIASDTELCAILWNDATDETQWVTVSDGTGLTWSTSVRIDDDITGANKSNCPDAIAVSGTNLYAAWQDDRNGVDDDIYFTRSTDSGANWSTNALLDKGLPTGNNPVNDYSVKADGDVVVVLIATNNSSNNMEELYFTYSTDAGTTFSAAIAPTAHNGNGNDVDNIDLVVQGDVAHMAWRDNSLTNPNDDVWYSSYDCTNNAFIVQDAHLSGNMSTAGGDADDQVRLVVDGSRIGVVWLVDNILGSTEAIWLNYSSDGGSTWCGDAEIGDYTTGVDDVDNPELYLSDDPACPYLVAVWEDDRSNGMDNIYALVSDVSSGCPVALGPDTKISIIQGGEARMAGSGDYVTILWRETMGPDRVAAACSQDGGATWSDAFIVSDTPGDADSAQVVYNDLYHNFVVTWLHDNSGVNDAVAGGFRHQEVSSDDVFIPGMNVNFDVNGFGKSEEGDFFAVLASGAQGAFALPDGRTTGLAFDSILSFTLNLAQMQSPAVTGTLAAGGTGSTSPTPVPNLPPGTPLYFMSVSFVTQTALGSITDVNMVTTQ